MTPNTYLPNVMPKQVFLLLPHPKLLGLNTWVPGKYGFFGLPDWLKPTTSLSPFQLLLRGEGHVLALGRVVSAEGNRLPKVNLLKLHQVLPLQKLEEIFQDLLRWVPHPTVPQLSSTPPDGHTALLKELARKVPRQLRRPILVQSVAWKSTTRPRSQPVALPMNPSGINQYSRA